MKKTCFRMIMFLCLCLSVGARAQDTHWSVNIYDYQYDMTAYLTLTEDEAPVTDLSDYEIAAFCGDECRGVATILTAEKDGVQKQYSYLRVRSNQQQGETITFKVYSKSKKKELNVEETNLTFQSQSAIGVPSNPMVLTIESLLMGDVDGDGRITINDAVLTISATFGTDPTGFNRAAADMDGDNRVTINDVVLIINQTF